MVLFTGIIVSVVLHGCRSLAFIKNWWRVDMLEMFVDNI